MKSYVAFLLLAVSLTSKVIAQDAVPPPLLEAAHCVATKAFAPPLRRKEVRLGYLDDRKSYPGDQVVYLVLYADASRKVGWVFTVFHTQEHHRQHYVIENNAKFVRSKNRKWYVDFVEPPLGGTWTQQHIVSAIRRIDSEPEIVVPVRDLIKPRHNIQCENSQDSDYAK